MPAQTWVEPVILTGRRVRMEPLRDEHFAGLCAVAFDAPVWRWTIMAEQDEPGLRRWVDTALANAEAGTERPFATVDIETGQVIGSSRYMSIAPEHKRLEIGWTWIGTAWQRTGRNREAKLLQLTHAFETLEREPGRVQDPLAQRPVADGPARHRRDVRGRPSQPFDHGRRLDPRLGLVQRRCAPSGPR